MDVSILPGLNQDVKPITRKKRRIPYRKPKSLASRSSGVLNKSTCFKYAKKKDESCILNESQLVSIKNISSFLKKNRELAKSLEESQCQKTLIQKELTLSNAEVMRMKEEVVTAHSRLLSCKCHEKGTGEKGVTPNEDILLQMKKLLLTCNDLVDCHIMTMFSNDYAEAEASASRKITDAQVLVKSMSNLTTHSKTDIGVVNRKSDIEEKVKSICVETSTQTPLANTKNSETQYNFKAERRNKKVQVMLTPTMRNVQLQCSLDHSAPSLPNVVSENTKTSQKTCVTKETQTSTLCHLSKATQADFLKQNENTCTIKNSQSKVPLSSLGHGQNPLKQNSTNKVPSKNNVIALPGSKRNPLQEINENQRANTVVKSNLDRVQHKPISILKKTASRSSMADKLPKRRAAKQKFTICTDEDIQALNRDPVSSIPKKSVRIHSPAQVREFTEYVDESAVQLRKRAAKVSYEEPKGQMFRGDATTDWTFYTSPSSKKKVGKKTRSAPRSKRRAIALEQVIQMVADDLRNSFSAEDLRNSFCS